jgi:hypothetical protein
MGSLWRQILKKVEGDYITELCLYIQPIKQGEAEN